MLQHSFAAAATTKKTVVSCLPGCVGDSHVCTCRHPHGGHFPQCACCIKESDSNDKYQKQEQSKYQNIICMQIHKFWCLTDMKVQGVCPNKKKRDVNGCELFFFFLPDLQINCWQLSVCLHLRRRTSQTSSAWHGWGLQGWVTSPSSWICGLGSERKKIDIFPYARASIVNSLINTSCESLYF